VSSPKPDPIAKIFRFTGILICGISAPSPCRHEGRFAVVTKRGAGCDGAFAASGDLHPAKRSERPAKSCGSGAATLASIPPPCGGVATGARKAVPRGEREVSRQTIARGRPGCPGCTCSRLPVCSAHAGCLRAPARGIYGCFRRPVFPAPSVRRGTPYQQNPGENPAAGTRERAILLVTLSLPLNPVSIRNNVFARTSYCARVALNVG
jgi:hypothetical protein